MAQGCDIRVYDPDFNRVGEFQTAESVQVTRNLYDVGSLEIHVHPDKIQYPKEVIRRGNVLVINRDGRRAGVIRDFYLAEERRKGELVIFGETGAGFCRRRICVPPNQGQDVNALGWDKINGPAETVIKHYAGANLVSPYDAKRKIQNLEMAADLRRGITTPWKARYSKLDEELSNICSFCEMGYEIYAEVERKRWVFDVIPGADRTKNQSQRSPVSFNLEYSNIETYKYSEDFQNFRNAGYAGGAGEDENRLLYVLGAESAGRERYEVFLDCGNAENIDELKYYGEQKLNEYKAVKTLEASVLPRAFLFGQDYFLGDLVSVYVSRLNLALDVRVTEVLEIWERASDYRYEIRFGGSPPDLYTLFATKQEVR